MVMEAAAGCLPLRPRERDRVTSARHRFSKRRKTQAIKPLAYVTQTNVVAGKLALDVPLNWVALSKLAGRHASVTVVVRVDMVLPSNSLAAGVPRVFVERITLKLTAAATGHART
jgi:hypothetical protein